MEVTTNYCPVVGVFGNSTTRFLLAKGMSVSCGARGEVGIRGIRRRGLESSPGPVTSVLFSTSGWPEVDGIEVFDDHSRQMAGRSGYHDDRLCDVETAVKAMKLGAFDFIPKPFEQNEIVTISHPKASNSATLLKQFHTLRREVEDRYKFETLIGNRARCRDFPVYRANFAFGKHVLITGESGTGKELIAAPPSTITVRVKMPFGGGSGIADRKRDRKRAFGHSKDLYRARHRHKGLFRTAEGGTIFLDEVGEIPLSTGATLASFRSAKSSRSEPPSDSR